MPPVIETMGLGNALKRVGLTDCLCTLELFAELCSKRTKSEARKIAGFVHLMRG